MTDQLASFTRGKAQEIDIIKAHTVGGYAPVIFSDAANGLSDQTFAGTRLADQPADFTLVEGHADAINCLNPVVTGSEFNRQVADIQ